MDLIIDHKILLIGENCAKIGMKTPLLDAFFNLFGFEGTEGFLRSTFHFDALCNNAFLKFICAVSLVVSVILTFVDQHLGIGPGLAIAFFVLLLFELITGVLASRANDKPITSKQIGRAHV